MLMRDRAEAIIDKVLSLSKAESVSVSLSINDSFDLRFALNSVTTCGSASGATLHISSNFGQRTGSISTTALDEVSLEAAVRHSEELAHLAPENSEFMPPLGPQTYLKVEGYDEETAKVSPQSCTNELEKCLRLSRSRELELAGFLTLGTGDWHTANSNGLRAHYSGTQATYSTTARTHAGRGSHKVQLTSHKLRDLKLDELSARAIDRAFDAVNPVELPPGRYPTILEPSPCADMLGFLFNHMGKRSADEGRSFFSDLDGKTKVGNKLFSDVVEITSDPQHPTAPTPSAHYDGVPIVPTLWISQGMLQALHVDRYWAKKTNTAVRPSPANILMTGSSKSLADLIASMERGVLVTNLWYIRDVDPQKLLITGLTRDGIFWIENGKVKHPIKNFRFNESPAEVLRNVQDVSSAVRAVGNEMEGTQFVVPAIKLSSFNFSTLSDAV